MRLSATRLLSQRLCELRSQVFRHLYNLIIRPHATLHLHSSEHILLTLSITTPRPQVPPRIFIIILINNCGMKEETPNERHRDLSAAYHSEAHPLQFTLTSSDQPSPRFKHQSFLYRGRLYVHGGTTIPTSDFKDDPLDLYCYYLEGEGAGRWERIRTRGPAGKELQCVSAHAGVVSGNKWYMFGGSNAECRPNSLLMRLNLDSHEWARLEQKGDVPTPRESAFLTFFEKNWLVLYGGISTTEVEIYNTFHFYNLDTRNWSSCQGPYLYQLYARLDPAIVHLNDLLYIFGGSYRNINNQERYLHDFYEISVNPPGRNQAGKVQIKRLPEPNVSEGRSGHNLVAVGNHHLVLMGGENTNSQMRDNLRFEDVSLVEDVWVFDTRSGTWGRMEVHSRNFHFRFRSMASCLSYNTKLYLFGGLFSYNAVLKDLVMVTLNPQQLQDPKRLVQDCPQCHQRERYPPSARYLPARVLQDVAEGITFPFAAIGLLIDNSMNSGASLLKISYFLSFGLHKQRMLKFQDDAKLNWTDEELLETLANFNAGHLHAPSGTDKKIKTGMLKQAFRREYGYNLKVGSLRLGEGFLFISYNDDHSLYRVCCFEKEAPDSPAPHYALHFYTYSIYDRKVTVPHMEPVRQRIMARFGDMLQSVFFQRKCRNTLLILNPRVQDVREAAEAQEEAELKADVDNGNIINGPINKIRQLQRSGFFIQECVDVSLRAYITCLYLKNECMKIMLSVRENSINPIEVPTQTFLEKVDRLCKHKHVLEINPALQFDLKISELYYLYDLKRKLSFFNNGLLIYHKNRLLTRFKYPLGELILRKYYKRHNCHNFIRLFGFIELPDHIPINFLKTSYLHHAMMERLFSRLKLISKLFKRELAHMAADRDYRRPAPTKLNQEELQQDKNQVSEPKPPKPRKVEPVPREISLRRKKNPPKSSLEGRLKQLLKDPTSGNIKEIIKLIEANSNTKQKREEFGTFYQQKRMYLGPNAPVGRPLSQKCLMMDKARQQQALKQEVERGESQKSKEGNILLDEEEEEEARKALDAAEEIIAMERSMYQENGKSAGNAGHQLELQQHVYKFEADGLKEDDEGEEKEQNGQEMEEMVQQKEVKVVQEDMRDQQCKQDDGAVLKEHIVVDKPVKDVEEVMEEEKSQQPQPQQLARQEIIEQHMSSSHHEEADEEAPINQPSENCQIPMQYEPQQQESPLNNHLN